MSKYSGLERRVRRLEDTFRRFEEEFYKHENTLWVEGEQVGLATMFHALLDEMGLVMKGPTITERKKK